MHPYQHALTHPSRPALVIADTGEQLSYRELDEGSNRAAQLFRHLGLAAGDKIGLMIKNRLEFPIVFWAAQRSGLLVTLISTHLVPAEAAYILNDCGAKLFICAADVGETPAILASQRSELIPNVESVFSVGEEPLAGAQSWRAALMGMPARPIIDQSSGFYLLYSSGTTGRPKGIMLPFKPGPIEEVGTPKARRRCSRASIPWSPSTPGRFITVRRWAA